LSGGGLRAWGGSIGRRQAEREEGIHCCCQGRLQTMTQHPLGHCLQDLCGARTAHGGTTPGCRWPQHAASVLSVCCSFAHGALPASCSQPLSQVKAVVCVHLTPCKLRRRSRRSASAVLRLLTPSPAPLHAAAQVVEVMAQGAKHRQAEVTSLLRLLQRRREAEQKARDLDILAR
jgi:hypothetical protein